MTDRVRIRRGKHGIGWVVLIGEGDWLWFATWEQAIKAADWWAQRNADRQRWTGGA